MIFRQLFDPESSTFTYLVADEAAREAILFDPVRDLVSDWYLRLLRDLSLRLVYVCDTHVHADHITGSGALREATGARTALHERAPVECIDVRLKDEQTLHVGDIQVQGIHTPGHTPCHLSYLVDNQRVLTGDALLIGGCGRTDFQGGDPGTLYDSVTERLFTLPDATLLSPGHDYRGNTQSTIGSERGTNPRFVGKSRLEFIDLMNNLGLPPPKRMMEAVPANRLCGRTPSKLTADEKLQRC